MKKVLLVISILVSLVSITLGVDAHPGRTDGAGGHTDSSTGKYHYHHGYSAHDHYDMDDDGDIDCPYEFKDKTEHISNDKDSGYDAKKEDTKSNKATPGDVLMVMFECLFPAIFIGLSSSYLLSYLFMLIWGEDRGCSISLISLVPISIVAYICLIFNHLS